MSIYFGNDTVNDLYVGLTPVSKGYVGTHLFYDGDNTIIDFTYEKYILNTQFSTLYNTEEAPVKSAILNGRTLVNLSLSSGYTTITLTGKNLFDKTKITADKLIIGGGGEMTSIGSACTDYIPVEAGKTYIRNGGGATIAVYDTDKNFIERMGGTVTFTATANGYIRWNINSYANVIDTMQIEEGTTTTTYEPYKTNILTVNEDVTLRSNGDVYDELNLLTGRLTQRIDENNEVLAQAVVKTVDLSVVNQDGNDTKLSTFNDITYVTLSSEGLIPEAELEVATKNEEVLNTMSLEMDDISATQTTLEEISNTQSENVDTTMIATTDIYEQLL